MRAMIRLRELATETDPSRIRGSSIEGGTTGTTGGVHTRRHRRHRIRDSGRPDPPDRRRLVSRIFSCIGPHATACGPANWDTGASVSVVTATPPRSYSNMCVQYSRFSDVGARHLAEQCDRVSGSASNQRRRAFLPARRRDASASSGAARTVRARPWHRTRSDLGNGPGACPHGDARRRRDTARRVRAR
jgi:hypothetical protein